MKEVMVNERIYEGLMRGVSPYAERQWWGVFPNQYKIMEDGTLRFQTEPQDRKPIQFEAP
jgi:hypothetical protein